MSKKRISGTQRRARRRDRRGVTEKDVAHWLHRSLVRNEFMGISLGGGKTDRTCMAVVEYYPKHNKIFLSHLQEKIQSDGERSGDQVLYDIIQEYGPACECIAYDVALQLPKCLRCRLKCPGYEVCSEPEMAWMRQQYSKRNLKKRPGRNFTPYTERCAEVYLQNEMEEPFSPSHALGSNMAPLTARALFLNRRHRIPTMEVNPKVSLWRIGLTLGIQKSYLRYHKHSFGGEEARTAILNSLMERQIAFVYEQDQRAMIGNGQAFDAFLCALTGVLKFRGQVEKRPKGFPRQESWIEIPKTEIDWNFA